MDYGKRVRNLPKCLECGDKIAYGRTDKKFCCEECRKKYNYSSSRNSRMFRRKVLTMLSRNYAILDGMIGAGKDSADLMDLVPMGFVPGIVTSHRRTGKHDVYNCFDIKYTMTSTRIFSMVKIQNLSVNLPPDNQKD